MERLHVTVEAHQACRDVVEHLQAVLEAEKTAGSDRQR
jgi:hypothetical protein